MILQEGTASVLRRHVSSATYAYYSPPCNTNFNKCRILVEKPTTKVITQTDIVHRHLL